jgi:DNA repair protein RadA/Sms
MSPRWLGKCPSCGSWNTFVEERIAPPSAAKPLKTRTDSAPLAITDISCDEGARIQSGIGELDRVLGGGFVPGSIVLVGGDPGIGKSTLALKMLGRIAEGGTKTVYVTGEESPAQVKMRAERLKACSGNLYVHFDTALENVIENIDRLGPTIAVIDSIQTMATFDFPSTPGSVGQIRECTSRLMQYAKASGTSILLIGHVTKEGAIAGPKVLEHLVDTVLYFEGGKELPIRILRAVKNRFGSTNEIGVFEMCDSGLEEVINPSAMFLCERQAGSPGSVVVPTVEGTRTILVELQALVSPCSSGMPRRTTIGIDPGRVSLLVAVLEKRVGLSISGSDVYMNVPGGVRVQEPAVDLGVCVSLASSLFNKPIDPRVIVLGEVGLAGEIRGVAHAEMRLREAARQGFTMCVLPQMNLDRMGSGDHNISLKGVKHIDEAIGELI